MPAPPTPANSPNYLGELPPGARVAVIRLRSLGDCVLTTPALALLKAHRPDLSIAVVVEDRFAQIFEGNPDIDALLAPEVGALRAFDPAMAINFHGGTRSMKLLAASGARIRAGFGHHAGSFLYNAKIPRAQEILGEERPVHTAEHLASAMFWLGVPHTEIPRAKLVARGPLPEAIEGVGPAYAVMHPFASAPDKTWNQEGFLTVARHLEQHHGLTPVIVAGPEDDVAPFSGYPVLHNAPLSDIKKVMESASLFVGNDSGPAHIAAAFGVPVAVLFGPSDPVTWAPWRTTSSVLTSPEGMPGIGVADVTAAVDALRAEASDPAAPAHQERSEAGR